MALQNLFMKTDQPAPFSTRNYDQMVQGSLDFFMNPNSQYMRQAEQQGLNLAAQRGGINSSIAAGAAQRSAVGTALPLAQQSLGMQQNAENVQSQNWLSSMNFNRELQGQMVLAPMNNSMDMLRRLSDYALQDPDLFTPNVMSGFTNFFNQNMDDMLSRYFRGDNA